jgi:hypothetical protein
VLSGFKTYSSEAGQSLYLPPRRPSAVEIACFTSMDGLEGAILAECAKTVSLLVFTYRRKEHTRLYEGRAKGNNLAIVVESDIGYRVCKVDAVVHLLQVRMLDRLSRVTRTVMDGFS